MRLVSKLAFVIVALGGVSVAQADLISIDDTVFGVDSITKDTDTGYEWLDITESLGLSLDFVLTELGEDGLFAGFRVATIDEIAELWFNAGITDPTGDIRAAGGTHPAWDPTFFDETLSLIELLGVTREPADSDPFTKIMTQAYSSTQTQDPTFLTPILLVCTGSSTIEEICTNESAARQILDEGAAGPARR